MLQLPNNFITISTADILKSEPENKQPNYGQIEILLKAMEVSNFRFCQTGSAYFANYLPKLGVPNDLDFFILKSGMGITQYLESLGFDQISDPNYIGRFADHTYKVSVYRRLLNPYQGFSHVDVQVMDKTHFNNHVRIHEYLVKNPITLSGLYRLPKSERQLIWRSWHALFGSVTPKKPWT